MLASIGSNHTMKPLEEDSNKNIHFKIKTLSSQTTPFTDLDMI